jgi:hypothetical protein
MPDKTTFEVAAFRGRWLVTVAGRPLMLCEDCHAAFAAVRDAERLMADEAPSWRPPAGRAA